MVLTLYGFYGSVLGKSSAKSGMFCARKNDFLKSTRSVESVATEPRKKKRPYFPIKILMMAYDIILIYN